jgi:hypothetical protein
VRKKGKFSRETNKHRTKQNNKKRTWQSASQIKLSVKKGLD